MAESVIQLTSFNVGSCNFSCRAEMDTDEFSLYKVIRMKGKTLYTTFIWGNKRTIRTYQSIIYFSNVFKQNCYLQMPACFLKRIKGGEYQEGLRIEKRLGNMMG